MNQPELQISQIWDVIVIGTGMGGATAGYALAQKGLSVLFLEKGGEVAASQDTAAATLPEARIKQGWCRNR